MTPEEFNRIKEEEKAHLRGLRDLKQQHRDAQRKVSILGALRGMRNPELEADTDARTEELFRGAATQEARLDLAMESEIERAASEADREALRQAEAADLVRQLKAEAGATAGEAASRPSPISGAPAGDAARTIGRTPPPAADEATPPASDPRDDKTLGRRSR